MIATNKLLLLRGILLFALIFCATIGFAQNFQISGKVVDGKTGQPIPFATVAFMKFRDSSQIGTTTQVDGSFTYSLPRGGYMLKITTTGYEPFTRPLRLRDSGEVVRLGTIRLQEGSYELKGVEIKKKLPIAVQKGDTTELNANAFKVNPDANAQDLITKMPGITTENGQVKAQGENVTQVLVDGKPMFGDDPNAALRNLPADVIDKVQIFDAKSDQAQFSGFNDGNTQKTLNILTKGGIKKGEFGRVEAGVGDERYKFNGNYSRFEGERRISLIGQSNNINQNNFSIQDLAGALGGGAGGRGGPGGRGGGGGGGRGGAAGGMMMGRPGQGGAGDISEFMVPSQNGVSTTHAFGLNYSDVVGKKLNYTASYFFNYSDNNTTQNTFRNFVLPGSDTSQAYTETSINKSKNINHRVNLKLEYKFDTNNSILWRPRFTLQDYTGNQNIDGLTIGAERDTLNGTKNQFESKLNSYTFGSDLLFRHKFAKAKRTLSVNINNQLSQNDGNKPLTAITSTNQNGFLVDSTQRQNTNLNKNSYTVGSNLVYTEPITNKLMLQLNVTNSYQYTTQDKRTFAELSGTNNLITPLSNTFRSEYITQSYGPGVQYEFNEKVSLLAQVNYQIADLNNKSTFPFETSVSRRFNDVLPFAMFMARPNASTIFRTIYRAGTSAPSIEQLQDVVDNSNPLQLSTGDPNLKQSYQHNLIVRYSKSNIEKASNFFIFLRGQVQDNYIGSSRFIAGRDTAFNGIQLARGSQLSVPANLSGYYTINSFANYGVPIAKIKTNLNLNLSAGFTRTPGLINGRANNANSQNYGLGVVLGSNISQNVDFTVSNNISYNNVQNTLQTDLNQNYYTNATSVRLNVIFKGFVFNTDFTNTINRGLSSASFNQNIGLWNMGVGRQLFKNKQGEIRFTVYDLLKQNQAITRNVTETYTEDVRSNLLQRYFMVTFSYRFRKISSNAGDMAPQDFKGPIPGMMPGMMPGMPMPGGGPPR